MSEESKPVAPPAEEEATQVVASSSTDAPSKSSKKKAKKSKGKEKASGEVALPKPEEVEEAKASLAKELFNQNVALQSDLRGLSEAQLAETLKKLNIGDLLTGLVSCYDAELYSKRLTPHSQTHLPTRRIWEATSFGKHSPSSVSVGLLELQSSGQ